MAKCFVCDSRKGKRECLLSDTPICSLCCGNTRCEEKCTGCSFYKPKSSRRAYRDVPQYAPSQMQRHLELGVISNAIEATFCSYDASCEKTLRDPLLIRILELLMDKYYFGDEAPLESDQKILDGYNLVLNTIAEEQKLEAFSDEKLVKVLGLIYSVGRRRSKGNREYLDFIHRFVGLRGGPGFRVM
jgi:hypothetical protein